MPEMDMQGVDPRDYYAAHPIANKVAMQTESHMVTFAPNAPKIATSEAARLRDEVFDRSLLSLQSVQIQLAPGDMNNAPRRASLVKMLKYMGYSGHDVRFEPSDLVVRDQALLSMTFATVVSPDCPDWRKSSSNNFSNSTSANMGCATEVNLGQMVADPRDLMRGTGELPPVSSQRGDTVIRQYRTGGEAAATSSAGGAPAAAASTDTTSAAPTTVPQ